ncbi:MAG: hypothetical protein IJV34_04735 [Prevotella sp.]|nr:hypothetical protein [Prevotella sp.]
MMKRLLLFVLVAISAISGKSQNVSVKWEMGNIENLAATVVTGDEAYTSLLSSSYAQGNNIASVKALAKSGADTGNGYVAVDYVPPFAIYTPTTKVTSATDGHNVTFGLKPATGHTMKIARVSFDCVKVGTDGGNIDVALKPAGAYQKLLTPVTILRNKIQEGNSIGYGHNEYEPSDVYVGEGGMTLVFSLYNINGADDANPKQLGLRNVQVEVVMDAEQPEEPEKPVNPKGEAVPLKRGLMALHQSSGNLVSWRARKSDSRNYKFKLYRGTTATAQTTKVNSGNFIMGKTNFLDASGAAGNYYKLEVYDDRNQVIETEVSRPTWANQTQYITLQGGAPTDPTSAGATYTPNDASFCDMDGDGEYEIVLKWAPSNEKDAASSGITSPAFYSCYKLDGTRLWMLHTGANMFNSAHTTPFVAWDMDGDGFGEFMVKTAPGAIDGKGNYVLLGNDSPTENLKSSRGKQDHGSEYITVFDGTTGEELKTIPYHTAYGDVSTSFWGDSNQNRSERYLAGIAWLSGENENPSAIFARGYYSGCNIGAYDWDGRNLTLRWLHRGTAKNAGTVTYADGTVKTLNSSVYGEGAHSFSVGDVTGDGKQEITYGSGALNVDGTTLYRTGLEHGDATHLGDFIPSRPGQEFFMAHEHKPYGVDLRDARTGEILLRTTASGDTGRGLMGHFNPEAEDAYWQSSADAGLYDTSGKTILAECGHGGGAGLSFRIFWNETLADDFYGKNIIEYWNAEANGFWRMQINGGNYVVGNYNNSSKQNPCVSGDLLGDWREEIVTWDQSGSDYRLIINATNYQTDYTLPHLMDDYAYRAQLVAENSVYNQPPHVSYDPRTEKTIVPETFVAELPAGTIDGAFGKYWGSLYTTYAVYVPEGVTAWSVTNRSTEGADTLKLTKIAAGKIIPKDRAIIFNTDNAAPKFVPTSLAANATVSSTYAKGFYCDSLVADANDYKFTYEFRNGDRGPGFYRTNGEKVIKGGTAYASFGLTATPGAESYIVGLFQKVATGIEHVGDEQVDRHGDAIYSIEGVRLTAEPVRGIYIKNGRKYVK